MIRSLFVVVGLGCAVASASHAASCCVDGPCIYISTLNTGSTPLNALCGHYIAGANGTCTINMTQDESVSTYANCVQLDGRVTLNMNSHSITCSGSSCKDAVLINSIGNVDKVVGDGTISGAWDYAVHDTGGNAGTIQDVQISLSGAKLTRGLTKLKTITRVTIEGATDYAIGATTGDTIEDSIIHDNVAAYGGAGAGLSLSATTSTGPKITGSLVLGNTVNVSMVTPSSISYTLDTSTVREPVSCNFFDGTSCQPASVMTLVGTNFVDDVILH